MIRLAITVLAIGLAAPSPAAAQTVDSLRAAKSVDERLALRCPPERDVTGASQPARVYPDESIPLWQDFADSDDLVLIAGPASEGTFDLGVGDDIALIYDDEGDTQVSGNLGTDTVLVCEMADLFVSVDLSDRGADPVADIVIIESDVFKTIPEGMLRAITLGFDSDTDHVVIHYPADLKVDMHLQKTYSISRIGDVFFQIMSADPGKAITLVPEE